MNVSHNELRRQTVNLLKDIDSQISEILQEAQRMAIEPWQLRDHNGDWIMGPLLLAKAQAINTLALLNDQRVNKR